MISMDSSPDIIKDASDALKPIEDRGITVMQGWYDKDLNKCHVTLWDLGETDDNFSDDDAEGVTLSLQITIFSMGMRTRSRKNRTHGRYAEKSLTV